LEALSALGTSVWIDALRRAMLTTGELQRLVAEDSVVGMTSNPSIFQKAILGSDDYDDRLIELSRTGSDARAIFDTLAVEDIQGAADVLAPVHERTGGRDGYVSLEVAPDLARDTQGTIAAARGLWERVDRPNVMIKIPGSPEGVAAIRASIAAGINVNVTLLFALDAYEAVAQAFMAGLEDRVARGEPIEHIASVASFFVSRVDTVADRQLGDDPAHSELKHRAAVANARLAYERYRELFFSEGDAGAGARFAALRERGATPQRVLWASTSAKDPSLPDVFYVEELAGADVINTMPLATLYATQDHAEVHDALSGGGEEARRALTAIEDAGVSLQAVTDELLVTGIERFAADMDKLITGIERRRAAVVAGQPQGVEGRLGPEDATAVGARVSWARDQELLRRIWRHDHTLWGPDPTEVTDRLGWLTVSDEMAEHAGALAAFASEVTADGLEHCALLGMGGSSLAPEVLRRTFGAERVHVLDSTHPDAIAALGDALPLEHTLFLVSSKSGTTLEPRALMAHFRTRATDGRQWAAITDPGSPLEELAHREGFRRCFAGVPEIGGRYSALSAFGMVPAALMGIDLEGLLERAEVAVHASTPSVREERSPALWLGLAVGELARRGRDKLTIVHSGAPLDGFGLWLEQLVAESTGKHGTGIVPVAGESLGDADDYGADRVFACLRDPESPDTDVDGRLDALAAAGHPVLILPVREPLGLGAQFFTWEMAIAVAGAVLEINPFDQPNVQEAKDLTEETIAAYVRDGGFEDPPPDAPDALGPFVDAGRPGDYVAVQAYLPPSKATDRALDALRVAIRSRSRGGDGARTATTAGYGPRYLHSTGQLHKGGPPSGRFLQLTNTPRAAVDVPGADYDFAALVRAQAIGDRRALRGRELPVLHLDLGEEDPATAIERLGASL
jgi:transaldolase/glucose-6-phosphate isomerase